ncbi:MAG TPA: hypothetical protein VGG83_11415 [Trebonia sp.]|jgi:hypothetical protein
MTRLKLPSFGNKSMGLRSVIALPITAAAVMIGTSMPANAATVPVLNASAYDAVHHCEVLGSDSDDHQAVVCVDIYTEPNPEASTGFWAVGFVEAGCQTDAGTPVQCANVQLEGALSNANGTTDGTDLYQCGHSNGACPAARIKEPTNWMTWESDTSDATLSYNVWTVAYGGVTQIELPQSDKTITLNTGLGANDGYNYSTGHYEVQM